jgi:hypothetical protein
MTQQRIYKVELNIPTRLYAYINVEATSLNEAEEKALVMAHNEEIEFNYYDHNLEETEIIETEELENDD